MTRKKAERIIGESPLIISLLYDLNLMPEQVYSGTKQEFYMISIVEHMLRAAKTGSLT